MKDYKTKRLDLKILNGSHAEDVLDYFIRNKAFLKKWEPMKDRSFYTLAHQQQQLEDEWQTMQAGNMLRLWIIKRNEFKIIGSISFTSIERGVLQSCYLGYRLDKDEVNKGYITESLRKGIDIMFKDYKLHRIEANIMPENKASLRVVEKLGFHKEGIALKYLKINNRWEDHMHMTLLNNRRR